MKTHPRHEERSARNVLEAAFDLLREAKVDCLGRRRLKEVAASAPRPIESFHIRRCVACSIGLATEQAALRIPADESMRTCPTTASAAMHEGQAFPAQSLDTLFGAIRAAVTVDEERPEPTLDLLWPLLNHLKKCAAPAAELDPRARRHYASRYVEMVLLGSPAVKFVLIYALGSLQPEARSFASMVARDLAAIDDPAARRVLAVSLRSEAPHLIKAVDSECWSGIADDGFSREALDAFARFEASLVPPCTREHGVRELIATVERMATALFTSGNPATTICNLMMLRHYLGEVTEYAHGTFQQEIVDVLPELRKIIYGAASEHRAPEFLAVEACAKTFKIDGRSTLIEHAAKGALLSRKVPLAEDMESIVCGGGAS